MACNHGEWTVCANCLPHASLPPSAGSGETEDIRELCAFVLQDFIHHPECAWVLDGKKCDCGVVEQGERAKRILARLAAHPAGPTRAEEGEHWIPEYEKPCPWGTCKAPLGDHIATQHGLRCPKPQIHSRPATPTTEEP